MERLQKEGWKHRLVCNWLLIEELNLHFTRLIKVPLSVECEAVKVKWKLQNWSHEIHVKFAKEESAVRSIVLWHCSYHWEIQKFKYAITLQSEFDVNCLGLGEQKNTTGKTIVMNQNKNAWKVMRVITINEVHGLEELWHSFWPLWNSECRAAMKFQWKGSVETHLESPSSKDREKHRKR